MDDHVSSLGALLREARERLSRRTGVRVRQADVAEYAEITIEWYARIERGHVLPSFDVLSRIAAALCLSSQERLDALRFVAPQFLGRDGVDPLPEPPARATRELRAYRRFHRQAESASTPHELIDMAVASVADGIPHAAFTSIMAKSPENHQWLHRSAIRPDVAEAINTFAPIDDRAVRDATLAHEGLRFVGSYDYGTTSIAHLRDRDAHTEFRSGFGVSIPLADGILGYCCKERGVPDRDHILFLGTIGNTLSLTIRSLNGSPNEPTMTLAAIGQRTR